MTKFFSAMFGGRTEDGQVMFSPETGINFDIMDKSGAPLLLSKEVGLTEILSKKQADKEQELDYYVAEYSRNGMHGPCMLNLYLWALCTTLTQSQ